MRTDAKAEVSVMKGFVKIVVEAVGVLAFGLLVVSCLMFCNIVRDFQFITSGVSRSQVQAYFAEKGKHAIFVLHRGERPKYLGWKLPEKEVDHTMEIYESSLAIRLYVYYDENDNVSYVFSSGS